MRVFLLTLFSVLMLSLPKANAYFTVGECFNAGMNFGFGANMGFGGGGCGCCGCGGRFGGNVNGALLTGYTPQMFRFNNPYSMMSNPALAAGMQWNPFLNGGQGIMSPYGLNRGAQVNARLNLGGLSPILASLLTTGISINGGFGVGMGGGMGWGNPWMHNQGRFGGRMGMQYPGYQTFPGQYPPQGNGVWR
jgi:hypothetical protein